MVELLRRRPGLVAILVFIFICAYSLFRITPEQAGAVRLEYKPRHENVVESANQQPLTTSKQSELDQPKAGSKQSAAKAFDSTVHPIEGLLKESKTQFSKIASRQSKTLAEAIKEYRRRYGLAPPPHFDKWFEFAQKNGVQMIDEFDTIHEVITPFWALKPKTIRSRAREALGYDNGMIGVAIRDHKVAFVENGQEWQQNATVSMMEQFLQYLPDMDLAFNMHDEPRVIVSHDDLTRLVEKAKSQAIPNANANDHSINDFTWKVEDVKGNIRFEETKQTRFSSIDHQATWADSRSSCPPNSPARTLEDEEAVDDINSYGLGKSGFVYNATAMRDICLTPSLRSTYGFFDRPNVFRITRELFPIFSQSKISSYGDLIYPSPWYWYEKVSYNQTRDVAWEDKHGRLFWRGSTTGGFSRNGGWRRQHRQQLVEKINTVTDTTVYSNKGGSSLPNWEEHDVARGELKHLVDVQFSHIGQCDPGDCDAQRDFFNVTDMIDLQDSWKYKYLLDMDGNAFSGRFYSFLQSKSQVFKQALFREWHDEWIRPWLHYVPLSMQGNDWLELVRYFSDDTSAGGAAKAKEMADESRQWANKVLRKVDMEAWLFRLLLEYARVIDDQREVIGFDMASPNSKLPRNDS